MDSKKKDGPRSWSVGVSAHYLHLFLKSDSDSTWTRMEENQPRRLHALEEGFLPAKNPSTSFWLPDGYELVNPKRKVMM